MTSPTSAANPHVPSAEAGAWKNTLNLPKTDFPMQARLPEREPEMLRRWEEADVYGQLLRRSAERPKFVLHDGPPYANNPIHLGHALNKILKDIVVKYQAMRGRQTEFLPGWDCHGLPIELQVDKDLGPRKKDLSKSAFRSACRDYAEKWLAHQREEFKRLGVLGRWSESYRTMSKGYEAAIVRELARFAKDGGLFRGKKPVHWCIRDRTALAEAEVEYEEHTSPSIHVALTIEGDLGRLVPALAGRRAELVVWTTTPWTLPANRAVAVHPEFTYVVYDLDGRLVLVARDRLGAFLAEVRPDELAIKSVPLLTSAARNNGGTEKSLVAALKHPSRIVAYLDAKSMEGLRYAHPLGGAPCPVILGDHVTLEVGTGLVHTAPGHGEEDYEVGRKYGLEVAAPVDDAGRFTAAAGPFAGLTVFEANPKIVERLAADGKLLSDPSSTIRHPYPHCWRCHQPVVFRATDQWFISMATNDLRRRALEAIGRVRWIPAWGEDRIRGMIEHRPDWCISRQRAWGVPIPVFYCKACGEPLVEAALMEEVARIFEQDGADAWFEREPEQLGAAGRSCRSCGRSEFRKETDILDVWFESGVSWAAVCESDRRLGLPVDLVLEGSDQHRGWFHSALLTSIGTRGAAPYRAVLTHGFVMDPQGEKMSKSKGNVVPPDLVLKQYGAEILRIWVAAADYRSDVRIDDPKKIAQKKGEILEGLAEGYRKIRNTLRWCLGNLFDFDPARHALPPEKLLGLDRWARAKLADLVERVRRAYDEYQFHLVFRSVLDFCAVEMSALYFDVLKDRLYTAGADSPARRSGQTVVHQVCRDVCRLIAPVMSFTADEAWQHLPAARGAGGAFLAGLPDPDRAPGDADTAARFDRLTGVRADVLKVLEQKRRDKLIGASLEAKVTLYADGDIGAFLAANAGELAPLFIVSRVDLRPGPAPASAAAAAAGLGIDVARAPGKKCPRCWVYSEAITEREPLCPKCREAVS